MAGAAGGANGGGPSPVEFTITLDGVEYPVMVDGGRTPPWKVTVHGRPFTVAIDDEGRPLVNGIPYDLTLEGETAKVGDESYPMEVTGLSVGGPPPGLPAPAVVDLAAPRPGAGAVLAIMPGKITRVMVSEGQEVEQGDSVCVLEAMKMENELRAERDGVVKAVHVRPGDDVEKDQVLMEIEAGTADA
jgi:biotin carboxyl carrier protein